MERREKYSRPLKRVFVPLLTLALVLTTAVIPSDSMKARNMAYADTNTNQVTLTAALVQSADKTTDRVELTIGVETIENLQLSGVQFRVEYPDEFTLIEKEVKDFFENGVSFFGPFKGEPNVTETARPMFCGFGSHGTDKEPREYVIKQKGDLVTLVFEANQPLDTEKSYTFSIQDSDITGHPQAFLLTTSAETNSPTTLYYGINNAPVQTYKPTHSGGTIGAVAGTTITAEVETTDLTTNKTTIKKQVIAKALENAGTDTADIVIDATTNDTQTKPQTKLELSKASMGAVAEKEKSLILQTNAGQLNFSTAAAAGIHNKTDGENLVITVSKKDEIKIDQNQTAAAVDFAVTAELVNNDTNESKTVTSFGGGEVVVTLDLPDGLQSVADKDIKCCYYNLANKNYTPVSGQIQRTSAGKKQFVFKTTHFSDYMVAKADTLTKYQKANNLKEGVTVSGKVKSYNPKEKTDIVLYEAGTDTVKATGAIEALSSESGRREQSFSISNVPAGTYDLVVSKAGHLKYTIKGVEVAGVNLDLSSTTYDGKPYQTIILLAGDVNEDGKINSDDLNKIWKPSNYLKNSSLSNVESITDINGDGTINSDDLNIVWMPAHYLKLESQCGFNF